MVGEDRSKQQSVGFYGILTISRSSLIMLARIIAIWIIPLTAVSHSLNRKRYVTEKYPLKKTCMITGVLLIAFAPSYWHQE
jgi:fructose-specific phosphotransferase system IIC component